MTKNRDDLLADDEAQELLALEYEERGMPVDQVAKARVWGRIERALAAQAKRRRWLGGAAAATLAAALSVIILQRAAPEPERGRTKGLATALPATLSVYRLGNDGRLAEMVAIAGRIAPKPGESLVFKVQAANPGFFTVALREAGGEPGLAGIPVAPVGPAEALVKNGADVFGYRVEAGKSAEVCALAAESKEQLEALTAALATSFAASAPKSCVSW